MLHVHTSGLGTADARGDDRRSTVGAVRGPPRKGPSQASNEARLRIDETMMKRTCKQRAPNNSYGSRNPLPLFLSELPNFQILDSRYLTLGARRGVKKPVACHFTSEQQALPPKSAAICCRLGQFLFRRVWTAPICSSTGDSRSRDEEIREFDSSRLVLLRSEISLDKASQIHCSGP